MKDNFLFLLPYLHKQRSVLWNLQLNFANIFQLILIPEISCSGILVPSAVTLFQSPTELPITLGNREWGNNHSTGKIRIAREICVLWGTGQKAESSCVADLGRWDCLHIIKVNLISRKKDFFNHCHIKF